jgi:hypothetical protein
LNDFRPVRANILPNDDLGKRMLFTQSKHFRNRQGFENVKTGGR